MTGFRTALAALALAGCWSSSPPPPPAAPAADEPAPRPAPRASSELAITGIEPARGDEAGDTYVVLKGRRFIADGPRMAVVYFGKDGKYRKGTIVRFASDRELIVRTPGGKAGEVADVLVIFEPGGELVLRSAFTYVPSPP